MKKFCFFPYNHLHFDPDGRVRICAWTDVKVGSVLESTVEEIWHSEKARSFRKSFEDGSFRYCRATSCPFLENNSLPLVTEAEYNRLSELKTLPTNVSIANDKTCNHSCPSCRHGVYVPTNDDKERFEKASKVIVPLLNQIKSFSANGEGDVFSSPRMLDMLSQVKPVHADCKITIETNGALFDEKHWSKIAHFGNYDLKVVVTPNSFVEPVYRYLNGGHEDYDNLMANLAYIRSLREKNVVNHYEISIVVQEKNFTELPEFIQRSIEEFKADKVIVKPLYNWFGMGDDDYWFKDVANPLHPYHEEWLEIMEHPILNHEKVYLWGAKNLHTPARHPAYRYEDLLKAVTKIVETEEIEEKINKFLLNINKKSIILYGETMITKTEVKLLKNKIGCIMALNPCNKDIDGVIVQPFCIDCIGEMDCVVVLNTNKMAQVKRDFAFNGYDGYLYAFNEFVDKVLSDV